MPYASTSRMGRAPREWLSTFLLLLSTFAAVLGLLWLSSRIAGDGGHKVRGTFPARVLSPAGVALTAFELPGLYSAAIPGDAVVEHRFPVEVDTHGVATAIYLERVRYAAIVAWDDTVIGHVGVMNGSGLVVGDDSTSVLEVPDSLATPGPHTVTLTVAAGWGEGGVIGDIRSGPTRALERLQHWREMERIGFALVCIFTSLVHLSIALRRRGRSDHLWFSLFMAALGVYTFAQTDAWFDAFGAASLGARLRVRRIALVAALAAAARVASVVAFERSDRVARIFGWVAGVLALVIATPGDLRGAALGNNGADVLALAVVTHFAACVWRAQAAHRPGAGSLVAAAIVGSFAILGDIAASRGWIDSSSVIIPSMLGVLGTVATVISIRDADVHDRFEALVRQARDGILLVRRDGVVTDANDAAAALLATPVGSIVGARLIDIVAPASAVLLRDHLARGARGLDRAELRGREDGAERVESVASPLHDGDVLVMLRDVTERRRLEEALVRAARMESVGQLAGGLAHDFNNVLGGILGQVNLLRLRFGNLLEVDARLERLERSLLRATGLCRRLVTLARGGSPVRQRVETGVLIDQALELIRPAVEAQVRLVVDVPDGLPALFVVPSEVEEALLNLVVNARDAMPEGGTVVIAAAGHGDGVILRVDDEGPGVPEAERVRIFEPFYSTKGPAKGTGLGLAVVQRVVRDHGGTVAVVERAGGGARFELWFPAAPADAPIEALPRGVPTPNAPAARVLVVDDEPLLRDAMAEMLANAGHAVVACPHAEAALDAADAAAVEVLVTDVLMPGISGIELATRLTARDPSLRVVLVSGYLPVQAGRPGIAPGWRVVEKPFRAEEIVRAVAEALTDRAVVGSSEAAG